MSQPDPPAEPKPEWPTGPERAIVTVYVAPGVFDQGSEPTAEPPPAPESPLPIDIEKALRQEVLEAQKSHDEFHKWKLIIAASLAAIALGVGRAVGGLAGAAPAASGLPVALSVLLLSALPAVCLYVDHRVMHVVTRMIIIGNYIRVVRAEEATATGTGHDYESFVHLLRDLRHTGRLLFSPFFEYVSTYLMCLLTVGTAVAVWVWHYQCSEDLVELGSCAIATASGVLSALFLAVFILLHRRDLEAISLLADELLRAAPPSDAPARPGGKP